MPGRRRSRALGALVIAGALAAVLGACSAEPPPTPVAWAPLPAGAETDPVRDYAEARLAWMTPAERAESLFMIHVPGTDAEAIRAVAQADGVGGIIAMGDNVPGSAAGLASIVAVVQTDPELPLLIAIDQEGGIVRRLPGDGFPAAPQLRDADPSLAESAFASRAALVASAGVSVNFGIVADLAPARGSFISSRSLGADAAAAAPRVAAAVAGEHGVVLSTLKHFPGHGAAPGDSHVGIPTTSLALDEWRASHAVPFTAGIDAGAELVMMGHLRYSAVDEQPATLSATWHGILRDELGFDGIIVTDDMTMLEHSGEPAYADRSANAVAAVAAGNTLLLYVGPVDVPTARDAILAAVADGRLQQATVDDAALRLLVTRRTLSGETTPFVACGERCRTLVG